MLPEPGMSCSVCHLHLMLSYVEMYERNKMMMMMMMNTIKLHRRLLSTDHTVMTASLCVQRLQFVPPWLTSTHTLRSGHFCYSAAQTQEQQRFTISEVAADRHELMIPLSIMWSSNARANGQLDQRCSQQTYHSHTRPSLGSQRQVSYYSFLIPLRVRG